MMTVPKSSSVRVLTFSLCVLIFSIPAILLARRDSNSLHSQIAIELWKKQDWHALRSLGENLYQTGRSEVQVLYLAMLASRELNQTDGVRTFAQRVLESRTFNWKIERTVATLYRPDSTIERLALFRTRFTYLISFLLFLVGLWSLYRRKAAILPAAFLSLIGLITLTL